MSSDELELVWNNIKAEARALADCEPMLASFFHATLLKHENLGSALSYMLANKLANPIMPAIAIREIVEEAYREDPSMIMSAAYDIQAVRQRDPAVDKYSTPLLYLKVFTPYRPTALATGCGMKAGARWRFICRMKSPSPLPSIFIPPPT